MSSSLRTSVRTKMASAPSACNSATNSFPCLSRRPDTTTRAPSCAKIIAAARPIPVSAPVIKTTGELIALPPLSRQIRDLESELGAQLLTRRARGIELTPAGRAFLDHARSVLSQVDAASEAARRVAHPSKPCFTMGFLTGHELKWMPEALQILRDELPNIDVMISSQYSPLLADGLLKGKIDAAFLRREKGVPELAYRVLVKEPLMVVLPSDHRLATLKAVSPKDLVGEKFVTVSKTAPVLRVVIDNYFKRSGVSVTPAHEADHLAMGMALIASTGGVGLLPAYAQNFLPSSVTSRPLTGDAPTVDLVLGYKKSNESPVLKLLLSRLDELVARASKKTQ